MAPTTKNRHARRVATLVDGASIKIRVAGMVMPQRKVRSVFKKISLAAKEFLLGFHVVMKGRRGACCAIYESQ